MSGSVVRPDEIGVRVREIRASSGMTLSEVSERCGVTVSHLWRLESGERRWNLEMLEKVLRAMKATVCLVVGDVKEPATSECGCDSETDDPGV